MNCRVRQFWQGVTARMEAGDHELVNRYLSEAEQALFYQMAPYDQRHCVEVARIAQGLGAARGVGIEGIRDLIRASLLHDVGKVKGDVGLFDRSLLVLCSRVPSLFARCARVGEKKRGGFFYACRVMRDHAGRGARMAHVFGVSPQVCELIRCHHDDPGDNPLLKVLQEADGKA